MRSSIDNRMNWLTLRFKGEMEHAFLDDTFQRSLKQVRFSILIGIFLYAAFGILDAWIIPDAGIRNKIYTIRYLIYIPMSIGVFIFTFSHYCKRYLQSIMAVLLSIGGLGIIAMTVIIPPPGSYLYYAGILLVLMYHLLPRLRFIHAAIISLVMICAYEIVAIWVNHLSAAHLINNTFFLLSTAILCLSTSYVMEFYLRNNFLQNRVIAEHTEQLENKNLQMALKNKELIESQKELMESQRNAEKIFSALTD